jgi:hypothetical protein
VKSKTLTVTINRPIDEVWEFTTNPINTPTWLEFIEEERTNEWPAKVGTMYWNRSNQGSENEFKVTAWEPNSHFQLSSMSSPLVVDYEYRETTNGGCELKYSEQDEGPLSDVFSQAQLEHLKQVMEAQHP